MAPDIKRQRVFTRRHAGGFQSDGHIPFRGSVDKTQRTRVLAAFIDGLGVLGRGVFPAEPVPLPAGIPVVKRHSRGISVHIRIIRHIDVAPGGLIVSHQHTDREIQRSIRNGIVARNLRELRRRRQRCKDGSSPYGPFTLRILKGLDLQRGIPRISGIHFQKNAGLVGSTGSHLYPIRTKRGFSGSGLYHLRAGSSTARGGLQFIRSCRFQTPTGEIRKTPVCILRVGREGEHPRHNGHAEQDSCRPVQVLPNRSTHSFTPPR